MAKNDDTPTSSSPPPVDVQGAVAPVIDAAAMHSVMRDLVEAIKANPAPAADNAAVQNAMESALQGSMGRLATAIQGDQEAARKRERDSIKRMLDSHDERRAASKKVTLKAVTPFTLVTDEFPEGEVISRGQEFEVSEFDLPRYLGRGLPTANEPDDKNGVTISQA